MDDDADDGYNGLRLCVLLKMELNADAMFPVLLLWFVSFIGCRFDDACDDDIKEEEERERGSPTRSIYIHLFTLDHSITR